MSEIRVKDNESRSARCVVSNVPAHAPVCLLKCVKREAYEKPSVRRKKKSEAARKRKFK